MIERAPKYWTLFQIEIVLHYHCHEAEFPRSAAPAYADTVAGLINAGVLFRSDIRGLETTQLGKALVGMWCATPKPVRVEAWVDPRHGRT